MAQLIVRNVSSNLLRKLKSRAGKRGRSMEAEHREKLRDAQEPTEPIIPLKDLLLSVPSVGKYSDFKRKPDKGHKVLI